MFYCPKCRRTYEDGSQRFCSNDGGRLLPALSASVKSGEGKKGVFSSLLGKTPKLSEKDETLASEPKFIKLEKTVQPDFPPSSANVFSKEPETRLEFEPIAETKPEFQPVTETKPAARLIKPSEIASGTASVGDRSVNPTGRLAISWEKPNVLLGQTVKGRYQVTEKLGQDETSISYLAQDKLSPEKKVVVRVLMEEDIDDLTSRIFAEERVSLSHLNHPNVAGLIDSGELLEGKPFIISEYVEGKSVKDKLQQTGQFNALRAARIIRQAAYALSEVHQNGVLHRNLKPENIILTVNEVGTEQVKVTDFAVSDGRQLADNPAYKSPEQLEGKMPSFASDVYSLAVIAYQMLTNRLPFAAASVGELIAAQKKGFLRAKPENLKLESAPLANEAVEEVLGKALACKPSDRYPKARDFGDAFFNALMTEPPAAKTEQPAETEKEAEILPLISADTALEDVEVELIDDEPETENFVADEPQIEEVKAEKEVVKAEENTKPTEDLPWEKRSPEPIKVASKSWSRFTVIGLIALVLGLWAIWYYFLSRPNQTNFTPTNQASPEVSNAPVDDVTTATNTVPMVLPDVELPPVERKVLQPPNTEFFQNTRENLDGELATYYRGFSFYYPQDWAKTQGVKNFVDVARKDENGVPIEQMIVLYYKSKGTFKSDRENFPTLVKESSKGFAAQIPNYRLVSEGEKIINDGWKVYEMKFEGDIKTKNGNARVFGRRLFMPAMRQGIKSGFVITMLATSLSPNVQSADDVGEKGELKTVLETFEPSQMY